jgi:hypothetical protein
MTLVFEGKTYIQLLSIFCVVLGELGYDPAERTVASVDPVNLNQVILAEGKRNANEQSRLYKLNE